MKRELGPVNTYFAPAFFVRNPKGRDGFHPTLRYSPLAEARSAARLMPRTGWNPSPSRAWNKCWQALAACRT